MEAMMMYITTACGECGDDIAQITEGKNAHDEMGWPGGNRYAAGEEPKYVHTDDNTPICRGRDDARRRKPGYFAEGE